MKRKMAVIASRVAAAFVLSCAISFGGQNRLSPVTRYFGATDGSAGVAVGEFSVVGRSDFLNVHDTRALGSLRRSGRDVHSHIRELQRKVIFCPIC